MPNKGQYCPREMDGQTLLARLMAKCEPDPKTGCWNWTSTVWVKSGYSKFRLFGHEFKAYQVMAWMFLGHDTGGGLVVCHRCNNRLCINPGHLYLATAAQNSHDAHVDGLCFDKARKLTNEQVYQAIHWSFEGMSYREIGERLGVKTATIQYICNGKNLSHLTYAMHLPRRRGKMVRLPVYIREKYGAIQ